MLHSVPKQEIFTQVCGQQRSGNENDLRIDNINKHSQKHPIYTIL